jgi:L-asparagine transporter-like permease
MFPKPAYRPPSTFLLVTSMFGVSYIIFGNMASNCLVFGIRVLEAANIADPSKWAVIGIAISVATAACMIHAVSRTFGIFLGNLLAAIKVLILTTMIVVGITAWAGGFKTTTYATANMAAEYSFASISHNPNNQVSAFLSVLFAYSGFDQPNYVSARTLYRTNNIEF